MRTSFSRRELYAHGEPLGNGATRQKLGGGYVCGFGGSSSSSSKQETNNYDQRVAVQDGIGFSGSSNNALTLNTSTTNNITDGGMVSRGLDSVDSAIKRLTASQENTVSRALDSININNATNAEGFNSLLGAAQSLWTKGESLIGQTQKSVADAYSQAQTEAKGTIDNRTIAIIAVAGAAALAFASRRK